MKFPLVSRKRLDRAEDEAMRLRTENSNLRNERHELKLRIAGLEGSNKGLLEVNADLNEKLKKASKNDARDKKGRFKKG